MMMVERHSKADSDLHSSLEKAVLVNTASEAAGADGTTKMMMSGPPFTNHSHILVWTDHDADDLFSLVLGRRLVYLQNQVCPILSECTFLMEKTSGLNKADTVVIASKRHFPYGGKKSDKAWTMIVPDPEYHR
jgi:hypothetical protein